MGDGEGRRRGPRLQLVVWPNQRFDAPVWERLLRRHPDICSICVCDPDVVSFHPPHLRLNQLRLVYDRVVTRVFFDALVRRVRGRVPAYVGAPWKEGTTIGFDPCNHRYCEPTTVVVDDVENPMFLLTREDCVSYYAQTGRRRLSHRHFYEWVKGRLGILAGVRNQDALNRRPASGLKALPAPPYVETARRDGLWEEAVRHVERRHPDNPGPPDGLRRAVASHLRRLPVTPAEARRWLRKFVAQRLRDFGPYEDAIVRGQPHLFHTGVAPFLNNGLLTPDYVLRAVLKEAGRVPLNSLEGLVRQVAGWREYCRLYYLVVPESAYRANRLGCARGNTGARVALRAWYAGTTGVPVVDDAIRDAFNTGYLHHIRRLMVMSNYMTLRRVHPDDVYAWMYEFSLDSWDWAMVFNVYAMGTWSDGGLATRKPYVSGAPYLDRMASGYGATPGSWTALYHEFRRRHRGVRV
jgi:deoxyribodipyrimidine photolyase-related protein